MPEGGSSYPVRLIFARMAGAFTQRRTRRFTSRKAATARQQGVSDGTPRVVDSVTLSAPKSRASISAAPSTRPRLPVSSAPGGKTSSSAFGSRLDARSGKDFAHFGGSTITAKPALAHPGVPKSCCSRILRDG